MSQEVMIAGALFADVPSIRVPDSNGNFHPFTDVSDTTAAAADVATGKYFYAADGTRTAGTNSGGGGGASNVVQGTFTTSSTTGQASTFTIPYTGNGYPIFLAVYIDGGMMNNTESGNQEWYNLIQQYAVGFYVMSKGAITTAPDYTSSSNVYGNYGVVHAAYKTSTTDPKLYGRAFSASSRAYNNAAAPATNALTTIYIQNNTTVSYFVGGTSYGLAANMKYAYIAVYSE